jgi:hypothetical protein
MMSENPFSSPAHDAYLAQIDAVVATGRRHCFAGWVPSSFVVPLAEYHDGFDE